VIPNPTAVRPNSSLAIAATSSLPRNWRSLRGRSDRIGEPEPIHQQIAKLHETLDTTGHSDDAWLKIGESGFSEELRSIGFHGGYATGLGFLKWYRDLLLGQLDEILEEAVRMPNLDEQVENDPSVKAAKQVYEEARAKTPEARKRL
jgi:hypothetical protein